MIGYNNFNNQGYNKLFTQVRPMHISIKAKIIYCKIVPFYDGDLAKTTPRVRMIYASL